MLKVHVEMVFWPQTYFKIQLLFINFLIRIHQAVKELMMKIKGETICTQMKNVNKSHLVARVKAECLLQCSVSPTKSTSCILTTIQQVKIGQNSVYQAIHLKSQRIFQPNSQQVRKTNLEESVVRRKLGSMKTFSLIILEFIWEVQG